VLTIKHLSISLHEGQKKRTVVKNSSFTLPPGESLGIVGESGSGKTITALSILRLLPTGMEVTGGSILYVDPSGESIELSGLGDKEMQSYRGRKISMIFQEPMTSLNPSMKCGDQIAEAVRLNPGLQKEDIKKNIISLLQEVHLPAKPAFYRKYPHELSGGQRQRIMIAMALAGNPDILIADEPTTALDVTVQKKILDLLREIQQTRKMSMLFISHDLGVIAAICESALVMYRGEIVESGKVQDLFKNPQHPYTRGLIACRPVPGETPLRLPTLADFIDKDPPPENISGEKVVGNQKTSYQEEAIPGLNNKTPDLNKVTPDPNKVTPDLNKETSGLNKETADPDALNSPLLEVRKVNVRYTLKKNLLGNPVKKFHAVNDFSFHIKEGETLGLIGESGCGKSTLGRSIIRLIQSNEGEILFRGENILSFNGRELSKFRQKVQFIFQDPYSSLNPKIAAGPAIMEVMKVHGIKPGKSGRKAAVQELLGRVGLEPEHFNRFPHEFSGGQRQRIGLARALATNPELIICDESVSSLDVSVQAMILNLLNDLKDSFNLTYLFISHDLSVVRYMSDRILVMKDGVLIEEGNAEQVFSNPSSGHTQELIDSILD